jgi:hypothetical protein
MPYGLIVIEGLELPWRAMAGRFEECQEQLQRIERLDAQMSLEQSGDAVAGAMIAVLTWQGRTDEITPQLTQLVEGPLPVAPIATALMIRGGNLDQARAFYAEHPFELEQQDWFSMLAWGHAAEVALWLEDCDLAERVYPKLRPYAGRSCSAGSGNASGPVDAYLALAARARGEVALAAGHADRAEELMEQWEIPLAADWLRGLRTRFSF